MERAGAPFRHQSRGGTSGDGAVRRRGAAVAGAAAALLLLALLGGALAACAPGPRSASHRAELARLQEDTAAALDLYRAREYELAARRFGDASLRAQGIGAFDLQRRAVVGECMAWLRAQRMPRFAECTARLESLQRRARRSEPGVNTLVALGAIAGGRPAPPLRVPHDVQPLVEAAAKEAP